MVYLLCVDELGDCLVLTVQESSNVVLHVGASGKTSGPGPCICENKSICVSSIH